MSKRKTPEEYLKECKERGLDLPIEDYKGTHIKIKHKCKHNHIYEQTPSHHLKGQGCPICNGNQKKAPKQYYNECKEKGLDLPIENYKNAHTRIKHKCNKGHIYKQTPNNHLNGQGCPICLGIIKMNNKSYYYNECKEKGLDLPIENYKNAHTKIKHKCTKCGNIYKQTPNSHLTGRACPKCNGSFLKTSKGYYGECKDKRLDLPVEDYINATTKIKHRCNICGNYYTQTPTNHLQNYGCPICNESHGEKFIRNYLDKNHIEYVPQKKFKNLKDKTYLSYDFYLPNQKVLIEYQGRQHYEENDFFGGKERFKQQQLHDKLKREYAKDNGYKLLELHYSLDNQDKVDKYLKRRLK